ncbi:Alpha/beta hydrolase fold [Nostocoides japonicum T1-X7]|uniref:Alpha/beta hydrolase fold n=1 Tax=Nostocoides japonicum T1-X7 TaxID=1194083 RepID=A0A077M3Q8_9MICO|nr:alpha/beta fold hydrolase [Tetrasphaera japonica]CCH80466.1 Alpha/beta hydrolase fold [Tetrasphaera japonica T1-X7]
MESYSRDGLRFPVRDDGPRDGEVVVLLHGFPQGPSAYDDVVPRLHEAGLRTLVPTLRGYARSNRPAARAAYSTEETTADVVALLDVAGVEKAHIVGHDWGAAPAWAVAAWRPDRVRTLTALSTPHPAAMRQAIRRSRQALRSWYMAFFQIPWLPEYVAGPTLRRTLEGSGLPAAHVEEYVRAMRQPGALSGALGWYRGVPHTKRPVGRITVPTTYLWGNADPYLARASAELTATRVAADYRFVELDEGHWLPEKRPAEVADAVLAMR